MGRQRRSGSGRLLAFAAITALSLAAALPAAAAAGTKRADARLDRALHEIASAPDGAPGVSALVQRGRDLKLHTAGRANLGSPAPIRLRQRMRIASVTKAFTGAVLLRLVENGKLKLSSTIGQVRPDLPAAWAPVTLRQLLYHTSGLPPYTGSADFLSYFAAHLTDYISPYYAISFVFDEPLVFPQGTRYEYSNTDNIVMALMAEKAAGRGWNRLLRNLVLRPLHLTDTSLPTGFRLPRPFVRGYIFDAPGAPLEDVSEAVSVSSIWSAGGIVSSARDLNRFVRAWGGGSLLSDPGVRRAQTSFLPPFSGGEPPGPGQNRGGLTLFRYKLPCGIVYGHTGNFPGYTQFISSSPDGSRSAVVSANLQLDVRTGPPGEFTKLRRIFRRAACAALAG